MKILLFCLLGLLQPLQAVDSNFKNNIGKRESGKDTSKQYENFKRQHIFENMDPKNCNSVIEDKGIRYPNSNECKQTNTFISAKEEKVKSVCKGQKDNIKGENLTKSKEKFDLVVCKKKKSNHPNCDYEGTSLSNRHIHVSCNGGLPVHYEGDTMSNKGGYHV